MAPSGPTTPTAPSGLTATTVSSSRIDLSWTDNSTNEDGFKIERSLTGADGSWIPLTTTAANATTYADTGLSANTTYHYRVRAYNAGGESANSTAASATTHPNPPAAPTGLTAVAMSSSRIDLSWTDNSTNEDGFKIERSSDGTIVWTQIATTLANATTYADTGLSASTTYHYRVRAFNTGGDSTTSNTAFAITPAPPPPTAPSGLTAAAVSASRIDLSWTDNSTNEDGFKIERSPTGADGSWTALTTTAANATTYSDTGLSASTTYHYRVRAFNATGGDSPWSNTAFATTPAALKLYLHNNPTPPTGDTTAQKHLSMNTDTPTATTLYKYSTNFYTLQVGRFVGRKIASHNETNAKRMANWVYQVPTTTTFSGNAELNVWVTLRDLRCDKTLTFRVFLREKTSATTDTGTLITSTTATSPSPPSSPCNFRRETVILPISRTIAEGNWLELKLTVNDSTETDGLFAYDTVTYDSWLRLSQ